MLGTTHIGGTLLAKKRKNTLSYSAYNLSAQWQNAKYIGEKTTESKLR